MLEPSGYESKLSGNIGRQAGYDHSWPADDQERMIILERIIASPAASCCLHGAGSEARRASRPAIADRFASRFSVAAAAALICTCGWIMVTDAFWK
jgi:hypothetical protein